MEGLFVKPGTKKELAYRKIKEMFLDQRFLPGTMLSENEIANVLVMSRTPVREALQLLQNEGFVTVYPRQGVRFQEMTSSTLREILELRAAVEGYVIAACLPLNPQRMAHAPSPLH